MIGRFALTMRGSLLAAMVILGGCLAKEKKDEFKAEPEKAAPVEPSVEEVFAATLAGQGDIVSRALQNGFDVNRQNAEGRTLLMMAAFNGHTMVARMLLQAGAKVDMQDKNDGSTALMFAASGPSLETVKLLLENGADINKVDHREHFTALMWAAAEGQANNVEYLLAKGADYQLKDIDGDDAATFAAKANHVQVVEILKAWKAKQSR